MAVIDQITAHNKSIHRYGNFACCTSVQCLLNLVNYHQLIQIKRANVVTADLLNEDDESR